VNRAVQSYTFPGGKLTRYVLNCLQYGPPYEHSYSSLLSLHVCRKTLRGGMPAILFTTTNAATSKERAESRDRDIYSQVVLVYHLFARQLLRGQQYHNSLRACIAAPARSASDVPEVACIELKVCSTVQSHLKSISRAKCYGILSRGAVVQVY
jgi:hypothetical protein